MPWERRVTSSQESPLSELEGNLEITFFHHHPTPHFTVKAELQEEKRFNQSRKTN